MLVKLAFVMQRLKKYLKKFFVMIDKDRGGGWDNFWILWGDTAVMRWDIEFMGVPRPPTPPPPLGKTLLWEFEIATVIDEFEFAVAKLNLPWWIWISCGKF